MIYNIARTELQMLFYSPVAWLLLVVFTVQSALVFTGSFEGFVAAKEMGYGLDALTYSLFSSPWGGLFPGMQGYLYFYIPLLTMGVVSRELSSGSIKLLYSSPITNFQIIIGKYFAMMIYGAIMIGVLVLLGLCGLCTVENFDWPLVLTGILGLYLLLCAYAAIGVFMSSLTSYQIVAAIGTLIVLMLLDMVGGWGQEIDFVRDITYWLAMGGRSNTFISGMICSEDVLYFIVVICLFLALTIIRLNAVRQKIRFSVTLGRNLVVIVIACLIGYFSSMPTMKAYYDATATKMNTLTPNSQEIVARLDGDLTITSYINILDPKYENLEETIVHELLHLKFYPLDQFTENLILANYKEGSKAQNTLYYNFFTSLEMTVEEMTKCFMLALGDNKDLSFGRTNNRRSFWELYDGLKDLE